MPRVWQGKNGHRLKRELPFRSPQNRIERVSVDIQVVPATASLVLTSFAPTVSTPRVVTPATAGLVLTTFAPTVATPRVVTPGTKTLTLTGYAPAIRTPRLVVPSTAALALAIFAPAVTATANRVVAPATAELFLRGYAPSIPDLITGSPGGWGKNLARFADEDHFTGPPYHRPREEDDESLHYPDITPKIPVAAKVDNTAAIVALYQSHAIDQDTLAVLLAAA